MTLLYKKIYLYTCLMVIAFCGNSSLCLAKSLDVIAPQKYNIEKYTVIEDENKKVIKEKNLDKLGRYEESKKNQLTKKVTLDERSKGDKYNQSEPAGSYNHATSQWRNYGKKKSE
jgi:hypothetical protein